jgi:deoxyribodipyrimidine photo-lyase
MVEAAARRVPVRLEAVDSNGLLPMAAAERVFPTAHAFRRFLQSTLPAHFGDFPRRDPLARLDLPQASLPREVLDRWRPPGKELLEGGGLSALPIDHAVGPGALEGGERAGARRLRTFL